MVTRLYTDLTFVQNIYPIRSTANVRRSVNNSTERWSEYQSLTCCRQRWRPSITVICNWSQGHFSGRRILRAICHFTHTAPFRTSKILTQRRAGNHNCDSGHNFPKQDLGTDATLKSETLLRLYVSG